MEQNKKGPSKCTLNEDEEHSKAWETEVPIITDGVSSIAPISTATRLEQQAPLTPAKLDEMSPDIATETKLNQQMPAAVVERLEQKAPINYAALFEQGTLTTLEMLQQPAVTTSDENISIAAETGLKHQESYAKAERSEQPVLYDTITTSEQGTLVSQQRESIATTGILEYLAPSNSYQISQESQHAPITDDNKIEENRQVSVETRIEQRASTVNVETLELERQDLLVASDTSKQAIIATASRLKHVPFAADKKEIQGSIASADRLKQHANKSTLDCKESKLTAIKAAPLILIHSPSLIIAKESTIMPRPFKIFSNLPTPKSLIIPSENTPESLFFLALAKVNNSALSLPLQVECIQSRVQSALRTPAGDVSKDLTELSPPDSVISAPPSYTFVLRQIARRRPRLMGTFIPSPSFILHTPPPNYGAAFDVYIDNRTPQPPPRIYNFGFVPMPAVCHECGHGGLTVIRSRITICTHLSAIFLCLFCCWLCVPLPYILRSCKDVYHYCANCRTFLGIYCPTNPPTVQ